jgi:hypothetical protein
MFIDTLQYFKRVEEYFLQTDLSNKYVMRRILIIHLVTIYGTVQTSDILFEIIIFVAIKTEWWIEFVFRWIRIMFKEVILF